CLKMKTVINPSNNYSLIHKSVNLFVGMAD
ncbi:MAG: hypothetical protein ACI9CP_002078, partial [Cryomorphaceae bacterium]